MTSTFDKRVYNEGRFGCENPAGNRPADYSPDAPEHPRRDDHSRVRGIHFKVGTPVLMAMLVSALYGGHYAAVTHDGYRQVAYNAFSFAFMQITQSWEMLARPAGLDNSAFVGSVIDFVSVLLSLFFAFFAGIGGAIVQVFRVISGS